MSDSSHPSIVDFRRDLHQYPEAGWKEFRTTALVADELAERDFTLHLGTDAVAEEERLGVPPEDELLTAIERARREGAPERYLDRMDGVTGLVAEKTYGDGIGPVVGIRVDMDALERTEAQDDDHRPAKAGFVSTHPNEMHACGHDGHTAIGLGVARELDRNGGFDGTLKLFFQPAEEGGRGGLPMSKSGHLDDVDHFVAIHLGLGIETGTVVAAFERPLSNAKLDVTFDGEPSHAGNAPQKGRNALQAAATAIQNLYAIPRHSDGVTRINIGQVRSENPQNIIPEEVEMRVEVRGGDAELNEYMLGRAKRIISASAEMHEVDVETGLYGKTTTFTADTDIAEAVADAASSVEGVNEVVPCDDMGGSEDASYLIRRVQENGGQATYVGIGASNPYGHHTARFDIEEESLPIGVGVVAETIRRV
ncbi:aminobenzoyl-glutamate utilization protein A [Haladaptatus litoreus]|uniref:Aminobenzoyl-glutamate utilization protein A n=1 Tax=Haladaptatus litoreus TaxID=553468 RepID=A0A1N6W7W5_9EURY|nr:amidohydrolase [Haladaptatus litoreus]SIQ86035.1 aminobenzoyl-glutamate utilization protein A [Haladaptatus litoreus]